MAILDKDVEKALVEILLRLGGRESSIGNAVKDWKVGSRVFERGRLPVVVSGPIRPRSQCNTHNNSSRYGPAGNAVCIRTLTEGMDVTCAAQSAAARAATERRAGRTMASLYGNGELRCHRMVVASRE